MDGIICNFYENGTCIRISNVMSVKDALSLIQEYNGKSVSVIGYNSITGEAIIRSMSSITSYNRVRKL